MIQIDMQMPTNCLDCPACNEYMMCAIPVNGRKWGENDVREFGQDRPEWYPLKEQEAVVRCKGCKHFTEPDENGFGVCMKIMHGCQSWGFCADGVKRDGDGA